MPKAQAVKLIERGQGGEAAQILARDFLLADDFGPGALKFFDAFPTGSGEMAIK